MKIAIMGTGGLGGYLGGLLAREGQDVTFIVRGEKLDVMRQKGLQVRNYQGEFLVNPVKATDKPAEVGPVDLILFCVKTYHVPLAAEAMKPLLGPETAIIPILNGIDHLATLSDVLGAAHVLGGQISMTAHVLAPGVVERVGQHGVFTFGEIEGGLSERCEAFAEVLGIEGINAQAVPDIMKNMWQKLALICGANLFAVIRGDAAVILRSPEAIELIFRAIQEGMAVAEAKGFTPDPKFFPGAKVTVEGLPAHFKPSMLVDLEAGRPIEVEALNGALSRIGREVNVPTPINDFIFACLKPYVKGGL